MEVSILKSLIRLTDYDAGDIYNIFALTDEIREGKYQSLLKRKSVLLFLVLILVSGQE